MTALYFILAIVLAAAMGVAVGRMSMWGTRKEADMLRADAAKMETRLQEAMGNADEARAEVARLDAMKNVLATKVAEMERHAEEAQAMHERQLQQLKLMHEQLAERQDQLLRQQINNASEVILKQRAQQLAEDNRREMETILQPLRDNLRMMRESVERSDRQHSTTIERLDAAIRENMKQARQVGERADRLAEALTGENKKQGNFGELRLRTLLENMGLEEGTQFEEQVTLRDATGKTLHQEDGHRMQPDVVLHFPDQRDVIIDSKMSLRAYQDYFMADDDAAREEALRRHVDSVRAHVRELARKDYARHIENGKARLDFVVMYVFSESALQLALSTDPQLWPWAYSQGVVIAGSQNLYMVLRVLELTWRQVRQAENQEAIMKAADEIVNRVQLFYERFQAVDEQLAKTRDAFDQLKVSTAAEGKSIVTTARKLIAYGAKENPKRKLHLPEK